LGHLHLFDFTGLQNKAIFGVNAFPLLSSLQPPSSCLLQRKWAPKTSAHYEMRRIAGKTMTPQPPFGELRDGHGVGHNFHTFLLSGNGQHVDLVSESRKSEVVDVNVVQTQGANVTALVTETADKDSVVDRSVEPSESPVKKRKKKKKGLAFTPKLEKPRIPIILYDNDMGVVCVNKPVGMTVHRSGGMPQRAFVVRSLLKRQLSRKVNPVHRLDHRTSGALLFGFTSQATARLQQALTNGTKQYLVLVRGSWEKGIYKDHEAVTIDKSLKMEDGTFKSASTTFKPLATFSCSSSVVANKTQEGKDSNDEQTRFYGGDCTLLIASPHTGRTHQIRRHAATGLSMPILGDTQHGDTKVNRWWREQRGLSRLALHCFSLDLEVEVDTHEQQQQPNHPSSTSSNINITTCHDNQKQFATLNIVAPIPSDLRDVLCHPELKTLWGTACRIDPRLLTDDIDDRGGSSRRRGRVESFGESLYSEEQERMIE
jgi:tRNA pseudouridine65 synthase